MRTVLPLILLGLVGCTHVDYEAPPVVWLSDVRVLGCNPSTLSNGQTLVLTLGEGHGSELSILRDSDNIPYFLVVQAPPPDMRLLMTREEFAAATRVELTSSIVGYKWVRDGGNELIFTRPGSYSVYVSTALESEEGGYMCKVNYTGGP
jgi:hypothetical protein